MAHTAIQITNRHEREKEWPWAREKERGNERKDLAKLTNTVKINYKAKVRRRYDWRERN